MNPRHVAAVVGSALALTAAAWAGHAWTDRGWSTKWAQRDANEAQEREANALAAAKRARQEGEAGTYALQELERRAVARFQRARARQQEIFRYAQTDAGRLRLDAEWVRGHDAAAADGVPAAGGAVAADAGATAAAALAVVASNYDLCHANADQLAALQEHLRRAGVRIVGDEVTP